MHGFLSFLLDGAADGGFDDGWDTGECDRYAAPRYRPPTRNQIMAARIKSGGATCAAHEVGAVLQHLLSLPR